jgi:hypothetical protein
VGDDEMWNVAGDFRTAEKKIEAPIFVTEE